MTSAKSRRIRSWPLSPRWAGTKCLSLSSSTWSLRPELRVVIILDVHPADAGFHRQVLGKRFFCRVALADDVAAVENRDQRRVIHAAVQLGDELARLADQIGLDFQAEREIAAVAGLGDLAQLVGRLGDVLPRIGALGMIERKAADQLGFEGVGQLAGAAYFLFEILVERHELVVGAVVDVAELHLADRRADRRDVHAVFVFQVAQLGDLALGELHHVLDAAADVDEPQAVVLQSQRRERGELLDGRLMVGRFVAEAGEHDLRAFGHSDLYLNHRGHGGHREKTDPLKESFLNIAKRFGK